MHKLYNDIWSCIIIFLDLGTIYSLSRCGRKLYSLTKKKLELYQLDRDRYVEEALSFIRDYKTKYPSMRLGRVYLNPKNLGITTSILLDKLGLRDIYLVDENPPDGLCLCLEDDRGYSWYVGDLYESISAIRIQSYIGTPIRKKVTIDGNRVLVIEAELSIISTLRRAWSLNYTVETTYLYVISDPMSKVEANSNIIRVNDKNYLVAVPKIIIERKML